MLTQVEELMAEQAKAITRASEALDDVLSSLNEELLSARRRRRAVVLNAVADAVESGVHHDQVTYEWCVGGFGIRLAYGTGVDDDRPIRDITDSRPLAAAATEALGLSEDEADVLLAPQWGRGCSTEEKVALLRSYAEGESEMQPTA
jgi:hypothetical protein